MIASGVGVRHPCWFVGWRPLSLAVVRWSVRIEKCWKSIPARKPSESRDRGYSVPEDMADKEETEKTIAEDLVVTKYKMAGEIVNRKETGGACSRGRPRGPGHASPYGMRGAQMPGANAPHDHVPDPMCPRRCPLATALPPPRIGPCVRRARVSLD